MQEIQKIQLQSLGQEDPLEKEMATHCSILAWKNSMGRGAWKATVHGVTKKSDMTEHTHTHVRLLPND